MIGPPTWPPQYLSGSSGFARPTRLFTQELAFSPLSRKKYHALPWNWFVPDLKTALYVPPKFEPTSTVAPAVLTTISSKASATGCRGDQPRQGSVASAPSM